MSIVKTLTAQNECKLVIPVPGKMFRSNISKKDKALCFVINKGYIDSVSLSNLLLVLDEFDNEDLIKVGNTEKIILKNKKGIVYRQRIFFKSLNKMFNLCHNFGIRVELGQDFHVSINSIMNITNELPYLEKYASEFGETIDTWLTNCCVIHINNLLLSLRMYSSISKRVNRILQGKVGYLDRAPFLISSYSISRHLSALFLDTDLTDRRLYSYTISDKSSMEYGYTSSMINMDIKKGIFDESKNA